MGSRAVMVRLLFAVRHGRATGSCLTDPFSGSDDYSYIKEGADTVFRLFNPSLLSHLSTRVYFLLVAYVSSILSSSVLSCFRPATLSLYVQGPEMQPSGQAIISRKRAEAFLVLA